MNAHAPVNPKAAVGRAKWRHISSVPFTVLLELGCAMLEGSRKYGRSSFRVSPVRATDYVDAAFGHLGCWMEGEDIDDESGLSHITKAIASLVVLRDAMIVGTLEDDRPPSTPDLASFKNSLQAAVTEAVRRHPVPARAHTINDDRDEAMIAVAKVRTKI